jgi:hypothetical protein
MMDRQLINKVISTNDFFGTAYQYRQYDIIRPVDHHYNGYYRLRGMIGYATIQAFLLGRNRLAWAVQFKGVPDVENGYIRVFGQEDERLLYHMMSLEERCAI